MLRLSRVGEYRKNTPRRRSAKLSYPKCAYHPLCLYESPILSIYKMHWDDFFTTDSFITAFLEPSSQLAMISNDKSTSNCIFGILSVIHTDFLLIGKDSFANVLTTSWRILFLLWLLMLLMPSYPLNQLTIHSISLPSKSMRHNRFFLLSTLSYTSHILP